MKSVLAALLVVCISVLHGCATGKKQEDPLDRESSSHPLYAFNLQQEGSLLLQQGRPDDALKKFQQADRAQPGNPTVANIIGVCLLRLQRHDEALLSFDRALKLVPTFTDAKNNRGTTYLALKQYRLAEVDFLAVLGDTTYPHRYEVFYNLGLAYLGSGRTGAAEENFRRAATAPTPVFEAYLQLAEIFIQSGRVHETIDLLEEARVKFPDEYEGDLPLAQALIQVGRFEDARSILETLIEVNPNSDAAQQARTLLESL
jgi:tetratricopeptide (TPR) repeat protein